VKLGWIRSNPVDLAEGVRQVKTNGFHTWTEAEIAQYRRRHPLGSKARLALEIILWTWQRRGDASGFGPRHMHGGRIRYTQGKGGKTLWLPAAPQLTEAITAMPATGLTTFLVTEFGKPFSKAGFGNKMREWCDQAGLPHCSAHGLRKAAARRAAELEATQLQLKAAGGWSGDAEVAVYTAEADQARLAEAIITRVAAWDLANRGEEVSQSPK
jgi:integrase